MPAIPSATPSSIPAIETERLLLRALTPEDSQAVLALCCGQEMLHYLDIAPIENIYQAQAMIAWGTQLWQENQGILLGLCDRTSGALLGTLHFVRRAPHRAHVSFDLHRDHWGQGLTPEALRGSLRYAYELLDVQRIECAVPVGNMRSARVLLKSGFVMEGVLRDFGRTHGKIYDVMMFSQLRNEWKYGPPEPPADL